MSVISYALSHQGHFRARNEDAYLAQDELGVYVVADGIGSFEDSEWASDIVVKPFHLSKERCPQFIDRFYRVEQEFIRRHHILFQESRRQHKTAGATLAAVVLGQKEVGIVWAGDSRVYLYRPSAHSFTQLTEDHAEGKAITRAMGVEAQIELAKKTISLQGDEVFLLCTDGLYKKLMQTEIQFILSHFSPAEACSKLIGLALERATKDNMTVLICALKT